MIKNQMEHELENEMDAGAIWELMGIVKKKCLNIKP